MAGEPGRAIETVDAALAQARVLGACRPTPPPPPGARAASARCGDHAGALATWTGVWRRRAREAQHELALTRRVLAWCESAEPGAGADLLAQADEVLDGLGIVWTPDSCRSEASRWWSPPALGPPHPRTVRFGFRSVTCARGC